MVDIIKKVFGLFTDEDYKSKYKITSVIGALIRFGMLFLLRKTLVNELGTTITVITFICSFILNYLIEKPLYHFTYHEVGIFYTKGYNAVLGSILYTAFYIINCTAILIIIWCYKFWIYYICLGAYMLIVLLIRGLVFIIRGD